MKYITLFPIDKPFSISGNWKSDFNHCWFINMYYFHTFYVDQHLCVDLTHQWVLLKIKHYLVIHYKTGPRGESLFLESHTKIKHCVKSLYLRRPLSTY